MRSTVRIPQILWARAKDRRPFWLVLIWIWLCVCVMGQTPEWIWRNRSEASADEICFFRKEFSVGFPAERAELTAVGDDEITVFLNGREVARSVDWKTPVTVEVTGAMREGKNVLAIRGRNGNAPGPAAALAKLEIRSPNNFGLFIVTDRSWLASPKEVKRWEAVDFAGGGWKSAESFGAIGVAPWGNVLGAAAATSVESLTTLPGFKAELLKSAGATEGSWICMTIDDKGRFIISPEKEEAPLLRITLGADRRVERTEKLSMPMRAAMGLLYAHQSLYINGRGPKGVGLYRLIDANQNDQFEPNEIHLLKNFDGDNEHGYHAVALGPDGMIYVMNGNHTKTPQGIAADSPFQNYSEDLLLPRQWDPNGHAKGIVAPGGYVLRTDPDGKEWKLICGGFRNTYDLDFNTDGEMFTFDSDMEWDIGAPWYRPTRINHCVSGGEYGWRSGSGKWPVWYPDSLPSNLDIGLSSPTGVKFGTKSNFPAKYRKALFACDWNYGKIFAVHLKPEGASYSGTFETFLSGKPLNVTSLVFGPDGAMYFIIGGWKTQSGLYRVSYTGADQPEQPLTAADDKASKEAAKQRAICHRLESFHGRRDSAAIDLAWPYLDSPDRWLRYAARVAIESQDVSLWQSKALYETRVNASINALLALARCGGADAQEPLLRSLQRMVDAELTEDQSLEALRVLEVCLVRMGRPRSSVGNDIVQILSRFYPARSEKLNRELSQLLVYLEAPDVIAKTLALMRNAQTQEEQMHYAFVLRNVKTGWAPEQRRAYFEWFNKALREFKGGNSFAKYLINTRNEALAGLTDAERIGVAAIIENRTVTTAPVRAPRAFVKEWTMTDLEQSLKSAGYVPSFARGKAAFTAAQCSTCHRLGNEGGSIGPDLNGVAGRFNHHDLLENILLPSKVISDRYQTFIITRIDGEEVSGCIAEENEEMVELVTNSLTQQREKIAKKDVRSRAVSKVSQMPEGLLNTFSKEEIVDLLAYVEANGTVDFGHTNRAETAQPFFPFCIDWHDAKKRTFEEQAAMVKELGYEGLGHIWLDNVAERIKSLDAAGLTLFQITMTVDVSPDKAPFDSRFESVLDLVNGRHVQFCLLVNGMKPSDFSVDAHAVEILHKMSDLAEKTDAQLLLYPHQGSWIERIEDAMRVADKVNRSNVGVMFNLCHWLRVDKSRDYKPLLKQAMPRLWAVSINGADSYDEKPGWDRYIQPLDSGTFDVARFLSTLHELGYKGLIGLQCYGIGGDARDHLARSMAAWKKTASAQ